MPSSHSSESEMPDVSELKAEAFVKKMVEEIRPLLPWKAEWRDEQILEVLGPCMKAAYLNGWRKQ